MDQYLNETEILSAMRALANAYPNTCTLFDLPYRTHENRIVRGLRIGTKATTDPFGRPKIGVFFTGSAHAREWGGADILVYLASDLLKAYAAGQGLNYAVTGRGPGMTFTASQLQHIRERVDLFLIPCVNPDGRAYSMSSAPLWRKNRNPASSGGIPSRVGVDINRNFDFLWDYRKAFDPSVFSKTSMASDDPASDNFAGPAPQSEAETRNVVHIFASNPQIGYFVDVHSYTGDMLYAWGDAPNQRVNPAQNFQNPAHDGKRGVDNLAIYGEYITEAQETTAIRLAETTAAAINAVTNEGYEKTQSFYLAPGAAGGAKGQTFPCGGAADDYATSRARSVPGASSVLGFTLEFHRYSGTDYSYAFHPPFPRMADIIAEVDAGLIAFCTEVVTLHDKPLKVPEIGVQILFGVLDDGPGVIIVGGKPRPVPPWDPLIPSLARALAAYTAADGLPPDQGLAVRRAALEAMAIAVEAAGKLKRPG